MNTRRAILLLICTLSIGSIFSQQSNVDKAAYELGMALAAQNKLAYSKFVLVKPSRKKSMILIKTRVGHL